MTPGLPEYGAPKTMFILDLHAFVHRFFHTIGGRCAHGVVEFVGKVLRERNPSHFVVCRDLPHPTFRHALMPKRGEGDGYKENRNQPPDPTLLERLRWSTEMIEDVFGAPVLALRGYEADDLIATVAAKAKAEGMQTVILGFDKDLMQLVDSHTIMWDGKHTITGPNEVRVKFGVRADQLRDYLAITGDGVDNVAGLHGAGPAAARSILEEWQTLEYALQHACSSYDHPYWKENTRYRRMLREQHKDVLLAQKLVTLASNAPIPFDLAEAQRSQ